MKRCLGVAMVVVAVVLLTGGVAAAKSPPNLVGDWVGTASFVGWNGSFYYVLGGWGFDIQNQDPVTGDFYGIEHYTHIPITGNVATNKVVTIITYGGSGNCHIFTGKVTGTKMIGTMQHFLPGSPGQIDTGTLTLIKQ